MMLDIEKLKEWVEANPEAAAEPFMNISTQRKITIKNVYEELQKEKNTGVAVVDDEIIKIAKDLESWLEEI